MNVSEIAEQVALILGESPQCMSDGEESPFGDVRSRVEMEVEECAREAVLSTPRMALTGWRLLPGDSLSREGDGSVILPLPDDFLMLFNLKMKGWGREVTEVLPADDWKRVFRNGRWRGICGGPGRPMAFEALTKDSRGGSARALRLCGCGEGDAGVEEGWYMPAPRIDGGGEIEIPPAAYRTALRLIVDRIAQKF